jgi:hypothetical protein
MPQGCTGCRRTHRLSDARVFSNALPGLFRGGQTAYWVLSNAIGDREVQKELAVYKGAKGSVQFPLDKPLPLGLIAKIVKFRLQETLANAKPVAIKKKKK